MKYYSPFRDTNLIRYFDIKTNKVFYKNKTTLEVEFEEIYFNSFILKEKNEPEILNTIIFKDKNYYYISKEFSNIYQITEKNKSFNIIIKKINHDNLTVFEINFIENLLSSLQNGNCFLINRYSPILCFNTSTGLKYKGLNQLILQQEFFDSNFQNVSFSYNQSSNKKILVNEKNSFSFISPEKTQTVKNTEKLSMSPVQFEIVESDPDEMKLKNSLLNFFLALYTESEYIPNEWIKNNLIYFVKNESPLFINLLKELSKDFE